MLYVDFLCNNNTKTCLFVFRRVSPVRMIYGWNFFYNVSVTFIYCYFCMFSRGNLSLTFTKIIKL